MERTEPSFVPEWLKGGNGSCSNLTAYQADTQSHQVNLFEPRQRSPSVGGNHVEIDSPRYSSASDRVFHPLSGRSSSSSSCLNERSTLEREGLSQSRSYSNYRRSAMSRLSDAPEHEQGCLRDSEHDQDWEKEQLRERERDRFSGFGNGDERERLFHDRSDEAMNWKHGLSASGKYDLDLSSKHSPSWGSPNKSLENGSPRHAIESGAMLGGSSIVSSSLTSSIQKAAFERNFPSLGSQEKQGGLQSNLGDVSSLSMRPFWQGTTHIHKVDGGRSSSPGLASVGSVLVSVSASSSSATDGWSSSLTEGPALSGSFLSSNGSVGTSASKGMLNTVTSSSAGNTFTNQQSVPKMAEALLQNQPRVRTPPQQSTESQRLEELALKQSRQLIPMKPSLPKTLGQGFSARDKPKAKTGRVLDVVATSAAKLGQPKAPPQSLNPLYRASVPVRSETAKTQPGMLVVQKTSKEAMGTAVSGVSSGKLDSVSPSQVSTLSSVNVGIPLSSSSMVNSGLNLSRKPKQLVDRRVLAVMPVPVVSDSGAVVRLKDGASSIEERKMSLQAQNRSDFFNTLRRQAAGVGGSASDNTETSEATSKQKCEDVSANDEPGESGRMVEGCTNTASMSDEDNGVLRGKTCTPVLKVKENGAFVNEEQINSKFDTGIFDKKNKGDYLYGDILEGTKDILGQKGTASSLDMSLRNVSIVGGSEEEEAAFLRSLGWVENPDDGEEALTEEEIATFLKEHMPAMISRPLRSKFSLRLKKLGAGAYIDKVESIQSSRSFSDSEF